MSSSGLEVLGLTMAVLGWLFAAVSCALPMWRVSAFIGTTVITAQMFWEGLWMECVFESTGQMVCKIHDSMLALNGDIQAARALTILSIVMGLLGILVAIMGSNCTNCVEEESAKVHMMRAAGVAFILASLAELIPVSWCAHGIVADFHNPAVIRGRKREIGAALYVGWAAAAFLLIGGNVLCCISSPRPEQSHRRPPNMMSSHARSNASSGYNRKDYV
ncbi:Claudin-4 Clostridium perfringens enterotoxin receptor [Collichthys lucidus]|uniref:Claudin-4 Clostridium perfringens enterotoxin receptor n=1 Tax=Collichthys lucidus TaxID=240159 RepID=A0A4U5V0N8_COLLU|nr:Claudin-4 Clostridium perfringens enterotoxin receptor [Collichthys lucidus]